MATQRVVESLVGLFMLIAIVALSVLAFKVSGLTNLFPIKSYELKAKFDEIGGLKVGAPVKIAGVKVGEVTEINIDKETFKAMVFLSIHQTMSQIPNDSSVGIYTAGLLGDNYIEITPMYSEQFFKAGDEITMTHSAMVLEKLIGQFIYKIGQTSTSSAHGEKQP